MKTTAWTMALSGRVLLLGLGCGDDLGGGAAPVEALAYVRGALFTAACEQAQAYHDAAPPSVRVFASNDWHQW